MEVIVRNVKDTFLKLKPGLGYLILSVHWFPQLPQGFGTAPASKASRGLILNSVAGPEHSPHPESWPLIALCYLTVRGQCVVFKTEYCDFYTASAIPSLCIQSPLLLYPASSSSEGYLLFQIVIRLHLETKEWNL